MTSSDRGGFGFPTDPVTETQLALHMAESGGDTTDPAKLEKRRAAALKAYKALVAERDQRERDQRYGRAIYADNGDLDKKIEACRAKCVKYGINPDKE